MLTSLSTCVCSRVESDNNHVQQLGCRILATIKIERLQQLYLGTEGKMKGGMRSESMAVGS